MYGVYGNIKHTPFSIFRHLRHLKFIIGLDWKLLIQILNRTVAFSAEGLVTIDVVRSPDTCLIYCA